MNHTRFGSAALALFLAASTLSACSAASFGRSQSSKTFVTRPVSAKQLTLLPAQVTLGGGSTAGIVERRTALERELESAITDRLVGRVNRMPSHLDKGSGILRVQHAFGNSGVFIYREFVGIPSKPRRRLAEGESRALAQASGADRFVVARFVGKETTGAQRFANSATAVAGAAAMGVLTLSPIRLLSGTASAVMEGGGQGSELRVALLDGQTGEILWANWLLVKDAPTPEVVGELVDRAFATFPPAGAASAQQLTSAR